MVEIRYGFKPTVKADIFDTIEEARDKLLSIGYIRKYIIRGDRDVEIWKRIRNGSSTTARIFGELNNVEEIHGRQ